MLNREEIARNGISGDLATWLRFNIDALQSAEGYAQVAAFPPAALMQVTTGLTDPNHFAQHGVHFVEQLAKASPVPLKSFRSLLDFGCGVGRLARLFKGFAGSYTGVDVDGRTIEWVKSSLPHVSAHQSVPRAPLPFADGAFDGVISISVFTHMNETDQHFYLGELKRVTRPGAILLLTVHGERALRRGLTEDFVFNLLSVPREDIEAAAETVKMGSGYSFIRQNGHLTTDSYDYGITFIGETYIRRTWSAYFDVLGVTAGAIHDFQDIVTLRRF